MQLIPVLDLRAGQAVHAVRGERGRYAPVQGVLGSGDNPVTLARAYQSQLGCSSCYVADLDAIAGAASQDRLLRSLAQLGLALWIDAGVASAERGLALLELGTAKVIIGSETLSSPSQLHELAAQLPTHRLVLSVDLKHGHLRAPTEFESPRQLVSQAALAGFNQMILLDLARVGAAAGPPFELLATLKPHFPSLAFYAGGGVRHRADLEALAGCGAAGALIATAFHRGALTIADVRYYDLS